MTGQADGGWHASVNWGVVTVGQSNPRAESKALVLQTNLTRLAGPVRWALQRLTPPSRNARITKPVPGTLGAQIAKNLRNCTSFDGAKGYDLALPLPIFNMTGQSEGI